MRRALPFLALGAVLTLALAAGSRSAQAGAGPPASARDDVVVTVVEPNLTQWGEAFAGVRVSGYLTGNWRDVVGHPVRQPSPPLPRYCRVRKMTLTLDEKTIVARTTSNAEAQFTLHWSPGYVQPGHYVVRALLKRDKTGKHEYICKGASREFWLFGPEGP
jgi:hypothetical protein